MYKFETLEKAMCKELETIEQKLKSGTEMTTADLDKADKLVHALKSLATYSAMKEAEEEYNEFEGMSGYRGRATNGRYVSRDDGGSYADGYSHGYYEGRSQAEAQSMGNRHMNQFIPEKYRY